MLVPSESSALLLLQVHLQHVSKDRNILPTTDVAELLIVHPALPAFCSG